MSELGQPIASSHANPLLPGSTTKFVRDHLDKRVRPSILICSNCQMFGLVSALQRATDEWRFIGVTVNEFEANFNSLYAPELERYEHIFGLLRIKSLLKEAQFKGKLTFIPSIHFEGYHPDVVYVKRDTQLVNSPLGLYHSGIIFAAYLAGWEEENVVRLFCEDIYRKVGYFDHWQNTKSALFEHCHNVGFKVEDHFYRWCADGAFMHTINHPKIQVLSDLANHVIRRIGSAPSIGHEPIPDALGNGPVFPVYPEVAAVTGARGSYRFKPHGGDESLSLDEFIMLSFAVYRSLNIAELAVAPQHLAKFKALSALLAKL